MLTPKYSSSEYLHYFHNKCPIKIDRSWLLHQLFIDVLTGCDVDDDDDGYIAIRSRLFTLRY